MISTLGQHPDWPKHAKALDMWLSGAALPEIGAALGISGVRAGQIVRRARAQLAFRVFQGVKRPDPETFNRQPRAAPATECSYAESRVEGGGVDRLSERRRGCWYWL